MGHVTPFYFLRLILSGAHYRLVLIFRVYLVLPAFTAYRTFPYLPEITEISILSSLTAKYPSARFPYYTQTDFLTAHCLRAR